VGIKGLEHIVDHPEDGLAALGLTEVITLGCMVHLVDSQFTGCDERLKEIEVISTTSLNHRHRRQYEIHLMFDGGWMRAEGLEGITKNFVPFHRLARE
jgi:hypothetical protein